MYSPLAFGKEQKLCGQIRINNLHEQGKHFVCYPLRVTYMPMPDMTTTQVLVWSPKRLFKRATKRNRLRRLMREAYRQNAEPLRQYCADKQQYMQLSFIYFGREELPYATIEKAMQKAISKLIES